MQFSLSSLPSDAGTATSLPTGGAAKPDATGTAASAGFADLLAGLAPGAQPVSPAGLAASGADAGAPAPTATLNPALIAGALVLPAPAVLANAAAIAPLVATAVPTATTDTDPVVTSGSPDEDAPADTPAGSERPTSGDLGIAEALVAAMMQPVATAVPAATLTLAPSDKTGTEPVDVAAGEGPSLRGSWTLGARGFGWNRAADGAARLAQPVTPQPTIGTTPQFPADTAGSPAGAAAPTLTTAIAGQVSTTAAPAPGGPISHPTSQDGFATAAAAIPAASHAPAPAVASADAPTLPTAPLPVPTSDRPAYAAAAGAPSVAPAAVTAAAAEKIAAAEGVKAASGRVSIKGDLKAAAAKRLAEAGPVIGISTAKPDATMPAGSMPVRTNDSDSAAPAPAVATSAVASHADQPALAPQLALTNTAHRAVEAVLSAADRFAARDQHSVNLQFSVAGADLNVRVELRAGEVHTTFRTDSPELRAALSAEWQTVTSHSTADRPVRLADPVFASNGQAGTSFSGENSSRQRQPETAPAFENGGFTRSGQRGNAPATAAPAAPAARSVSANSLHLHTLA